MRIPLVATILLVAQGLVAADEPAVLLRVATFNVNWGNRRPEPVLSVIATSRLDVVFLQETTLPSEAFLRERLKASHPYFYVTGHYGQYPAERFAFVSAVPLRDVACHPPVRGMFGFHSATYDFHGTRVRLVNVHLTPFVIEHDAGILNAMAAMKRTEAQHAAEIRAICDGLDAAVPTIVAGDFNSPSTFAAPTYLREQGFTDSFAATHADADAHATWSWPTRPIPMSLRVDYVFHTRQFITAESGIVPMQNSDHSLVVCTLRLTVPSSQQKPVTERGS